MKIIHQNLKKGIVKIRIEGLDDLWHLNQLIDPSDFVSGQTFRKIKLGKSDERSTKVEKKKVFVTLQVEKAAGAFPPAPW